MPNDGSEFGGLVEHVKAQEAAAAAAKPAPAPEKPKEPEQPKAPEGGAPAAAQPAAEAPKPGETPAQAAARRKFKLKGKVAGEDREWEIDEDDLDETKETEGRKKLVERFQKAEDYDRPGGALDQLAARRAAEKQAQYMLERGIWVRGEDGKLYENPLVHEFDAWKKGQGAKPAAPAQSAAPAQAAPSAAAPAEQTPRQKRIAELEAKYEKEGTSLAEQRELTRLWNAEENDAREAQREAAQREIVEKHKAQTTEEQRRAENARAAQEEIDKTVASVESLLRDPVTGKAEPEDIDVAKRLMTAVLLETRDWDKARQAVRDHAARHAARLKSYVDKLPKQATAPPPAPVAPAGQPSDNGKPKDDGFDPTDPFKDGDLARFARTRAG